MKKTALILLALGTAVGPGRAVLPQDIQHETAVINIEIPVRVFKGDVFIDKLTRDDFELYEDGKRQKVEAFYLVKKTIIERRGESKEIAPPTARPFFPFFALRACRA